MLKCVKIQCLNGSKRQEDKEYANGEKNTLKILKFNMTISSFLVACLTFSSKVKHEEW